MLKCVPCRKCCTLEVSALRAQLGEALGGSKVEADLKIWMGMSSCRVVLVKKMCIYLINSWMYNDSYTIWDG